MTRIVFTLASLSIVLLATALLLGLSMGDLNADATQDTLHWAMVHRLTGVAAALAVVFVESVVVTYFIGTSRWCKEVVETYRLDRTFVMASNRLKRRTFPWALAGMLTVVAVAALGAAADPGSSMHSDAQAWAGWHLAGALIGILLIAWTYVIAWNHILANHAIIQQLVDEVGRIRRQRGLEELRQRPSVAPAAPQSTM